MWLIKGNAKKNVLMEVMPLCFDKSLFNKVTIKPNAAIV